MSSPQVLVKAIVCSEAVVSELIDKPTPRIAVSVQKPKPKLALYPKHPERVCWGCDKYCSADDLRCGNGTVRTPHPIELFGEDWMQCELNNGRHETADVAPSAGTQASPGNDIG